MLESDVDYKVGDPCPDCDDGILVSRFDSEGHKVLYFDCLNCRFSVMVDLPRMVREVWS